jgi:hypothetical protein
MCPNLWYGELEARATAVISLTAVVPLRCEGDRIDDSCCGDL